MPKELSVRAEQREINEISKEFKLGRWERSGEYDDEPPINDRFDLYNQMTALETKDKEVNRDWTLSSLTPYESRFVIEMSKTADFFKDWVCAGNKELMRTMSEEATTMFKRDYFKRLVLSRARNGMLIKGGILAVVGNPGAEGTETSGEDKKKGGFLSKIPLVGRMFQ